MKAFFILLLFTPLALIAQCNLEIKGKIVASGDAHAVPFATVYEEEQKKDATADENGEFVLTQLCPGHIHLAISQVNHEAKRLQFDITSDTVLTISLSDNPNMLATITVVGEDEKTNVGNAKSALSRRKLDNNTGKSIGEALDAISGVTSLKTGPGIAKPMIHGLYGNRIRMVNNGIRQEGQQWGNEHAPEIDPFGADRITVVKGSAAVKYGTDAISGAILVDPADLPEDHHLHGEVSLVGMSNGLLGAGAAQVEGGIKDWNQFRWRLQGTIKAAGDFRAPGYFLTNTGIRESNFQVTVGTKGPKLITNLYFSHFETTIGILRGSHIGNLTDLEEAITRDEPFFTNPKFSYEINSPKQEVSHNLLKASVMKFFGKTDLLEIVYGFQHNRRKEYDIRRLDRSDDAALDMILPTNTVNISWQREIGSNMSSDLGFRYMFQTNTNEPGTGVKPLIPNYDSSRPGAYWLGVYSFDDWDLEFGVAYDYQNLTAKFLDADNNVLLPNHQYHNYSGSIGVSVPLGKNLRYSGSTALASRAPNINELYSSGLHHGAAAIEEGDPNLEIESSLKTIHSITWSNAEKWGFEVSGYFNRIDSYIFLKPQDEFRLTIRGAFPVYAYEQTNVNLWGIDVGGRVKVAGLLYWSTNASTVHGYDRSNEEDLIYMPADRWKNTLNYTIPSLGKLQDVEFSLGGIQVWEQKRTPMNEVDPTDYDSELAYNYAVYEDYLPPPPGYFLTEIATGFSLSTGAEVLKVHMTARNLLNVSYRDYLNRMRYFADDTGFSFELRLKYQF